MQQHWLPVHCFGEESSAKHIFSGTSNGEKAHLCIMAPYLAKVGHRQNEESDLSTNGTREPQLDLAKACQEQHPAAQRRSPNSDTG